VASSGNGQSKSISKLFKVTTLLTQSTTNKSLSFIVSVIFNVYQSLIILISFTQALPAPNTNAVLKLQPVVQALSISIAKLLVVTHNSLIASQSLEYKWFTNVKDIVILFWIVFFLKSLLKFKDVRCAICCLISQFISICSNQSLTARFFLIRSIWSFKSSSVSSFIIRLNSIFFPLM
jgi:hypothetical protein